MNGRAVWTGGEPPVGVPRDGEPLGVLQEVLQGLHTPRRPACQDRGRRGFGAGEDREAGGAHGVSGPAPRRPGPARRYA